MKIRAPKQEDVRALTDLLIAYDLSVLGEIDTNEEDIENIWKTIDKDQDAFVAETELGETVGYAFLVKFSDGLYECLVIAHPEGHDQGIEAALLRHLEARLGTGTLVLRANNEYETNWVTREGFIAKRYWWTMGINLSEAPSAPEWPNGLTLRTFVLGEDDVRTYEAFDACFSDHWGYQRNGLEHFMKRTERPAFDSNLWFLLCDGDKVAAFTFLSRHLDDQMEVGHLGVRREYRKQGLGQKLLHHAFRVALDEHRPHVYLNVDSESLTGATRLYESAGMHVKNAFTRFDKEVTQHVEAL